MTNEELDLLAAQVRNQLEELNAHVPRGVRKHESLNAAPAMPDRQRAVIERETGISADTFWRTYKQAARKDLCHKDGLLYKQWHQWKELRSQDAVKVSLGVLAGLGITGTAVPAVAVAASVILLNIVVNIGVEAICSDEKADKKASP